MVLSSSHRFIESSPPSSDQKIITLLFFANDLPVYGNLLDRPINRKRIGTEGLGSRVLLAFEKIVIALVELYPPGMFNNRIKS